MSRFKKYVCFAVFGVSLTFLTGCGFGQNTTATILLGSCNLESVSGGKKDSTGNYLVQMSVQEIAANGWIGNDAGGTAPEEVIVSISDSSGNILVHESGSTIKRPDVATFFNKPGMENSGFEVLIKNLKKPGRYTISLQGKYNSGYILCPVTFTLVVS